MKFLRRPQVQAMTGLPTSTLYDLLSKRQFPAPIRLTPGRVAWLESDVLAWQHERLAENGREIT